MSKDQNTVTPISKSGVVDLTPAGVKAATVERAAQAAGKQQLAQFEPGSIEAELAADAGRGFEHATAESFAIPFLLLLQDLSPQVKSKMSGYVQGAKPGMIYNTVGGELYAGSVHLVPCHFAQTFIEWIPKDKGGGFVAEYPPGHPRIAEAKRVTTDNGTVKDVLPNGNEIYDTRQHYCLLLRPDGGTEGVLLSLKGTARKVSKRWNSQQRAATVQVAGRLLNAPPWAYAYELGVAEEANAKGSWYRWDVKGRAGLTDADLYRKARAFADSVSKGERSVDYTADDIPEARTGQTYNAPAQDDDDDVTF